MVAATRDTVNTDHSLTSSARMSAKKSKFVTAKKEIFEGERRKDTKCTRYLYVLLMFVWNFNASCGVGLVGEVDINK